MDDLDLGQPKIKKLCTVFPVMVFDHFLVQCVVNFCDTTTYWSGDWCEVMARLIVGNYDCSYEDVFTAIRRSAGIYMLRVRWINIARGLEIPEHVIHQLRIRLAQQTVTFPQAYTQLLIVWRSLVGNGARLEVLIEVLETYRLQEAADSLRLRFKPQRSEKSRCDKIESL